MKVYHYDRFSNVFTYESNARELERDPGNYAIPAYSTTKSPFDVGNIQEKECYFYNQEIQNWEIVPDHRGFKYYDLDQQTMKTITTINTLLPENYANTSPPSNIHKPKWNGRDWEESALMYKGFPVETKYDVDRITARHISEAGEEKAKTEKLLAGEEHCPSWDNFIIVRQFLIDEGNDFIKRHNLV